ncbi:MAG: LA2681 family HEPN domain-containing protein [Proteobacteria bacterium]|jgi:hypothetical protein|nr:LA2681 family HEPN domain-containing protein [Pseudomonadota bacterium]
MSLDRIVTKPGDVFHELSVRLSALLDADPCEAVRRAREIALDTPDRLKAMWVRAAILVDGGAATRQQDAIEEGLRLFRELYEAHPHTLVAYNLANALAAIVGYPPYSHGWLDHQERTREQRAEARRLYWKVARDTGAESKIRTQAWTNLANLLTHSFRLGEAHDARLAALQLDPANGVAAGAAARDLIWLFKQGDCSDLTRIEAEMLAKIAKEHQGHVSEYVGARTAKQLASLSDELGDPPSRSPHSDPFVRWVERERLTLAPAVELVDPALGKLDWLSLPGIMEREPDSSGATPPPVFAMFNVLKADFILARDLAWRATEDHGWPETGRFADTLDYANYGPQSSALVLAHRTALDLLDKVAVTANHYFEIGLAPDKVYFGRLWRQSNGERSAPNPLVPVVEKVVREGAYALFGLAELAEDYETKGGILHPQKELRNAGTHRFVVLHDLGDPSDGRQAPEVERYLQEPFVEEVLRALRVARSAIQMLSLAIKQRERRMLQKTGGPIGELVVPDHDWIRGHETQSKP